MMIHVDRITLIRFQVSMLRSSLYDYSDAYILVIGTTSIEAQAGDNPKNAGKKSSI